MSTTSLNKMRNSLLAAAVGIACAMPAIAQTPGTGGGGTAGTTGGGDATTTQRSGGYHNWGWLGLLGLVGLFGLRRNHSNDMDRTRASTTTR